MDKQKKPKEKYVFWNILQLFATQPITNAEDMLCIILRARKVNAILKSRVREIRKHGSVGGVIAETTNLNII